MYFCKVENTPFHIQVDGLCSGDKVLMVPNHITYSSFMVTAVIF